MGRQPPEHFGTQLRTPLLGGPEFFLRRYGSRGRPECSGDRSRERERERVVPGAGTGTRRERERERAGERAPGRGQERRQASGGGKPGDERRGTSAGAGIGAEAIKGAERGQRGRKAGGRAPGRGQERREASGGGRPPGNERRGGDRSGERPAGAEGRRGTSAGSNRKRCRTSPQGLNSGQTMPPSRMLTRNTPPPTSAPSPPRRHPLPLPSTTPRSTPLQTSPRLHHHAACFRPSQPAPALPEGPKRPPAGPGTGSHRPKYAQPTHRPKYTQPTHRPNTHKKRAASAAGCRPMERMRRLYSRSSPVSSATGGS